MVNLKSDIETCFIKSPLGYTKIVGDDYGIVSITVLNSEENPSETIPLELEDCVIQLQEYFDGSRTSFQLKAKSRRYTFSKTGLERTSKNSLRKNHFLFRTFQTPWGC